MAGQWRLRHKLLLGLALGVGVIAVLLLGTLEGINSYRAAVKTTDSKLRELGHAERLRQAVAGLTAPVLPERNGRPPSGNEERKLLLDRLHTCRVELVAYQAVNGETVCRKRDPDEGAMEGDLVSDLRADFDAFERGLQEALRPRQVVPGDGTGLVGYPALKVAQAKAARDTDQLRGTICDDVADRIDLAKRHDRRAVWVVGASAVVGLTLLFVLLYCFYRWVLDPMRALQAGVQRVAAGEFDKPIELRSGDELEELAGAFNVMTARLSKLLHDLERQVHDRSRQLVRSERLVSVGFLAAGVAHEINNPLASIAFCGEALERRLARFDAADAQQAETVAKYTRMIQEEAFRCKGITSKLLEFSRAGELVREPTDLVELVRSVLEIAQHLQNCKGKRVAFHPAARLVAPVNAQDVKSVVLNLVVNALDSMEEGGELNITLVPHASAAVLTFADTGCGMTPDVLDNIFEPFFTRSRTGKGTGLGLFISHQVVHQHGGELEAVSGGPGRGSTFTVRLPLRPAGEAPATLPHPALAAAQAA